MTSTLSRPASPVVPEQMTEPAPPPAPVSASPDPAPARSRGVVRVGTSLLLLAGLLLGFLAYLFVLAPVQQLRTQHTLYETFAGQLALAVVPVSGLIEPGSPIAILEIPSLGLSQVVVEGTTSGQLMKGPGHRRDTVLPGQAGVTVVQGRSGLFGGPFGRIGELVPGDSIVVITGQGRLEFVVASLRDSTMDIPPPSLAASVLNLITASPAFGPDRSLIVSADLLSAVQGGAPGYSLVSDSERGLAGDPAAALPLMLWGQVLLLVLVGATWAYQRWDPWPTYLLSTPILLATLWNVYENAAQLLPNTM